MLSFVCTRCTASSPADPARWCCPACGGTFQIPLRTFAAPAVPPSNPPSIWRYAANLPVSGRTVTLGEGGTPLLPGRLAGTQVQYKCEHLSPTGSFKDRGASVLVSWLKEWSHFRAVEDSSGNAGVAIAAYASRAGIQVEIHVPRGASRPKTRLIEEYGGATVVVPGNRQEAAESARRAAGRCAYASHVYQPHFLQGTKTLAYEIWEQTLKDPARAVAVPVGNGSLVLGLFMGFLEVQMAGLIQHVPRLLAYQSDRCAPLAYAFRSGLDRAARIEPSPSRAEGIAISDPPRGAEILRAVRETAGWIEMVPEEAAGRARADLARTGFLVEWTSAVAVAGVERSLRRQSIEGPIVIVLTASGLKDLEPASAPGSL